MLVEKKLYKNPLRPAPPPVLMPLRHILTLLAKPSSQPSTPYPRHSGNAAALPCIRYFNATSTLFQHYFDTFGVLKYRLCIEKQVEIKLSYSEPIANLHLIRLGGGPGIGKVVEDGIFLLKRGYYLQQMIFFLYFCIHEHNSERNNRTGLGKSQPA